ncbi:nicotinamide riboside transporter PnuC [Sphingobacterium sp. HJSM2_6]|uniref:nicotinamide riboside transporter PnuC n=1 Tax=Sphingobacterium sp. HJSM2_6 TaxID=3366264 RepID=UPI003BD3C02C
MQDLLASLFNQFIQTSAIEWAATLTGILSFIFATQENSWTWPIGIVNVFCFAYIFIQHKIYGEALLQVYFLATAIYGWYFWNKQHLIKAKPILTLSFYTRIYTVIFTVVLGLLIGFLLANYTDTDVAYPDGLCVAMCIVAQYLTSRKILESWFLWILVDCCYIPLFFYKGLFLTCLLFVFYTFLAWKGYKNWLKSYHKFA